MSKRETGAYPKLKSPTESVARSAQNNSSIDSTGTSNNNSSRSVQVSDNNNNNNNNNKHDTSWCLSSMKCVSGLKSGAASSLASQSEAPNAHSAPATSSASSCKSQVVANCDSISSTSFIQQAANCNKAEPHKTKALCNTSTSQHLSSIDILNENRQRQLQFKQQESFKQHVELRQQQLIAQQQLRSRQHSSSLSNQGASASVDQQCGSASLAQQQDCASSDAAHKPRRGSETARPSSRAGVSSSSSASNTSSHEETDEDQLALAYRVNTSVPDYMTSALAKQDAGPTSTSSVNNQASKVNPFSQQQETRGRAMNEGASRVSGKSGFLSALMDEASCEAVAAGGGSSTAASADNDDEARATASKDDGSRVESRYSRVVCEGGSRFNYARSGSGDGGPGDEPFYRKDLSTLLMELRASRKLVILIVAIALLLDNMLLTSVVPIIPAYLYQLRMQRDLDSLRANRSSGVKSRLGVEGAHSSDGSANVGQLDGLARLANESIARARDRYSGSFFHPRVKAPPRAREPEEPSWESGEAQANYANQQQEREEAEANGDESGQDREDDADSFEPKVANQNKNQNQKGDEADDYEETDEQEESWQARDKVALSSDKPKPTTSTNGQRKGPARSDQSTRLTQEDGSPDEESGVSYARRWQRAQQSLQAAAKAGNDSRSLGGMCLNLLMADQSIGDTNGRRNGGDDDDDERDAQEEGNGDEDKDEHDSDKDSRRSVGSQTARAKQQASGTRAKLRARRMAATGKPANKQRKQGAAHNQTASSSSNNKQPDNNKAKPANKPKKELVARIGKSANIPISHQAIVDESLEVGVMFASKPIVQAFANPFIGTLTNRVGFSIPMFTGFVIMFASTLVFAFGSSYSTLFIARAIQGVGSACTSVAGMSMLADRFPDDAERGHAMSFALGGLAMGVVIGPPFGGFMFEYVGKSSPFIVLAILALLDGLLQLLVLQPRVTKSQEEGASLLTLIKDPYILVAAGAITFANTGIAILEPALPLWMIDKMQATNWQQGVAFLPAALSYMLGTNLFGNIGLRIGRWRSTMIGLLVIGFSLLLIPFASRLEHLYLPNGLIGFAMGMVDSTMMPMLGYLVDIRHTSVYGSVYAIGDVAFCASFAFGPALSGTLVELVGFEGLVVTTAFICFSFAPLLVLLRNPPARQPDELLEGEHAREQAALRYVNYSNLDSPDADEEARQLTREHKKSYVH